MSFKQLMGAQLGPIQMNRKQNVTLYHPVNPNRFSHTMLDTDNNCQSQIVSYFPNVGI